ncbi:hypothetical protein BDB00DRAFT_480598 [Zychaea mexicana]|uniref:uncharacterized protein n=1 Tax=Zychaea mexicana TaxID=64656 RepID=UPI0022FE376B|nr:uncharacterized protein BDB00DRAFT_480598 [Zychaea mexicana]KAI9491580.1 hypothetical protein BDB00DRAFT_480598 [Zychaea mexicana]
MHMRPWLALSKSALIGTIRMINGVPAHTSTRITGRERPQVRAATRHNLLRCTQSSKRAKKRIHCLVLIVMKNENCSFYSFF